MSEKITIEELIKGIKTLREIFCGDTRQAIEKTFPGVFEEEWEDITLKLKILPTGAIETPEGYAPFKIAFQAHTCFWKSRIAPFSRAEYMIKGNRVFRRKKT